MAGLVADVPAVEGTWLSGDGDGWIDLYITNLGSNQLYRNRGDGTFEDVTADAKADDPRWSTCAAFVDYDRDGDLDLYVSNYVDFETDPERECYASSSARDFCGPDAYTPVPDRMFRNRGDGTFEDVSVAAGINKEFGAGFGVPLDPELKVIPIGESELLRDGDDAVIVAYGTLVHPALEAAAELAPEGISAAVLNARFAKPLDVARIEALARRCPALVTLEEAAAPGGFGAAVLEALSAAGIGVRARCLAIPDQVVGHGDPGAARRSFGLDRAGIARAVLELIQSGER